MIFGNGSSGKSTLARRWGDELGVDVLELDAVRWKRRPDQPRLPDECAEVVRAFTSARRGWIVEGLHASLLAVALQTATELHFLNPGFEVCRQRAMDRPWDPRKTASPAEQAALIERVLPWFQSYDSRDDETSLSAHRRLYDAFEGLKWEHTRANVES
ncbi:MAG: hypothetical protein PVI30_07100 [Myxococcales bacterium]